MIKPHYYLAVLLFTVTAFLLSAVPVSGKVALGSSGFSAGVELKKVDSKPLTLLEKSLSYRLAVLGNSDVPEGNPSITPSAKTPSGSTTESANLARNQPYPNTNTPPLPKQLNDFQHGSVTGQYDATNVGPLGNSVDDLAGTFTGGKYTEVVLDKDVVLYRAGTSDRPLGQFFTQQAPDSVIQTRIDSAVLPKWPNGAASPIDSKFEIKIPAGTKVYVGEVSGQGGHFVGGTQQIVVPKPWLIEGVEVLDSAPLK